MLVNRAGRTLHLSEYTGNYGPGPFRRGLLSDHVAAYVEAGGVVRDAASGTGLRWAIVPGEPCAPVVCSEIIPVFTEDGRSAGRCGAHATTDVGACEEHAEHIRGWIEENDRRMAHMR